MIKGACLILALMALLATCACASTVNVAFGKPVTLIGTLNNSHLKNTLVDDVFLPRSTQWQTGTVWWNGLNPIIEIDLQGSYLITGVIVQADDNDSYRINYRDAAGAWLAGVNIPNYDAWGWGMQTRPNPNDNEQQMPVPTPFTATALRLVATGGDNMYSVSEIQAYAEVTNPVPETGAMLLALGGLPLGLLVRRIRK